MPAIGDLGAAAFAVTASAIYFVGPRDVKSGSWPLKKYSLADGKVVDVGRFEKPLVPWTALSVSPDEKWLLDSQIDLAIGDLRLVENFR